MLLGNGVSISVADAFRYESLRAEAENLVASGQVEGLSALQLFGEFETDNFETVLWALETATRVVDVIGDSSLEIRKKTRQVRELLFSTVRATHPRHDDVIDVLRSRAAGLAGHGAIFTTNFDLLLYWMFFQVPGHVRLVDYFWNEDGAFDPNRTEVFDGYVPVFYVHGGLHLNGDARGDTWKRIAGQTGGGLLSSLEQIEDGREPLFVSEGTHHGKLQRIHSSHYLSFAYEHLSRSVPIVTLGHAFHRNDMHVAEALAARNAEIAVGIFDEEERHRISERFRVAGALDRLTFFWSQTHPVCGSDSST